LKSQEPLSFCKYSSGDSGQSPRKGAAMSPLWSGEARPPRNQRRGASRLFHRTKSRRRNHHHERQHQFAGCIRGNAVSVVFVGNRCTNIIGNPNRKYTGGSEARTQIGNSGAASGTITTCRSRRESRGEGSGAAHV